MINAELIEKTTTIKYLEIYQNGLRIIRKRKYPTPMHRVKKRKGIFEMSKKSKWQLTHIIANSGVKFRSIMTLTYGDFFIPLNGEALKKHLQLVLSGLRKRYNPEYIWFIEFTKQDRPHIHIFLDVEPNILDRDWLGTLWAKITVTDMNKAMKKNPEKFGIKPGREVLEQVAAEEAIKVRHVHTHVRAWEKLKLEDGATRYALKYTSKAEQKIVPLSFHNIGRFWGTSEGVTPKVLETLEVGEDITEEELKGMFEGHRVSELPMLPGLIIQQDATQIFRVNGIKLSIILEKKRDRRETKSKNP